MRVYVMPADAYGCGHYRLIWPADVLRKQGYDVQIMPGDERSGFAAKVAQMDDGTQQLVSVRVPDDADVIVLQRPAMPLQIQMIQMMRQNDIAVVVDMDDDMSDLHRDNIAYESYNPKSLSPYSWKVTEQACREATFVTTSTRRLQDRYARHGRGLVIDNYVPEAYLEFTHFPTGKFGWAGTTKSHPNDLQVTGNAVPRLIQEDYRFTVVGGLSKVQQCLRLEQPPETCGSVPLQMWVRTICQSMDVGLAPLAATAFNAAKSRLKLIEYMSAGVPWVASPREEYRKVHRESGVGLLADTPKQWYQSIKRLMDDESLRREQAEAGKAYMADQTYQAQAWRWMEAWEQALKIQRGGT